MGAAQTSCAGCVKERCVHVQGLPAQGLSGSSRPPYLHPSHVDALLNCVPPEQREELDSSGFRERCGAAFRTFDRRSRGVLEGDDLSEAVQTALPHGVLGRRLNCGDTAAAALAFDMSPDGRIAQQDFCRFCQWTVAMELCGFFSGTAPSAQVAEVGRWAKSARRLLLVSESLDPERQLRSLALPDVRCVYYRPDGLTLDGFSAQLEAAAIIRRKRGCTFESVALANHGPDEDGLWHICSDWPVPLRSTDQAWEMLMPLFHALADMVTGPEGSSSVGHVDLLACSFAATSGGLDCLAMIEQRVKARFSASTDETGNAAQGGDWVLERGDRNVAAVYFKEARLGEFEKLMKPGKRRRKSAANGGSSAGARTRREKGKDVDKDNNMTRMPTSRVIAKQLKEQIDVDAHNGLVDLGEVSHTMAHFADHKGAAMKHSVEEHYSAMEGLIAELANLARNREAAPAPKLTRSSDPRMKAAKPMSPPRRRAVDNIDPWGRAVLATANPQEFEFREGNHLVGLQAELLRRQFRK